MAPRGITWHPGFRKQIKKKNVGQIYIKHIAENNGLLSLFIIIIIIIIIIISFFFKKA